LQTSAESANRVSPSTIWVWHNGGSHCHPRPLKDLDRRIGLLTVGYWSWGHS
jgi:hypothetical protein